MYTIMSMMDSEISYRQESVARMVELSRQEIWLVRSIRIQLGRLMVTTGTRLSAERREEHEAVAAMRIVVTSPPWNRRVPCPQML